MLGIDPKAARATWTVILIVVLCLIIYAIRQTLFVFIVALLFAYLLLPLVDLIDRVLPMRRSRAPALAIVYAILVSVIVVTGIEIGSIVAYQANNLAEKIGEYLKPDQPAAFLPLPQPVKPWGDRLMGAVRTAIQAHYQELLQTLPQAAIKALGAAANLVVIIVVPILSFFFLKDGRALQRYFFGQIDGHWDRVMMQEIVSDLNVLLAQYMRALVLLGMAASVTYGAFFAILRIPYGALLAALAFPLEFIPMLGPLLSATIILVVVGFSGGHHILLVFVFLAVYRVFQDYVLSPHLMSTGTELHPLLIIFGVFAGEQMAGIPGAFLSVPVMAVLRLLYRRLERARIRKEITAEEIVPASQ